MSQVRRLICLFFLAGMPVLPTAAPVYGQGAAQGNEILEPETLIGLTLEGIYGRFGIPQEVYAVRGQEAWQDDVVLVYPQGDFYVFRDRVWQMGLSGARGIRVGDSREAAALALGETAREGEGCFILPIPDRPWPMALRVNIVSGQVSGIFVYRSDF
jgi:hypothetical protein